MIEALEFYDLTNVWGHGMPEWPSSVGIRVNPVLYHAKDGVSVAEFDGIMHRGTHMDARRRRPRPGRRIPDRDLEQLRKSHCAAGQRVRVQWAINSCDHPFGQNALNLYPERMVAPAARQLSRSAVRVMRCRLRVS